MKKVVIETYSNFYDYRTKIQFAPVLDRRTTCQVGVADVEDEAFAEFYEGHEAFRVVDEDEWREMTSAAPVIVTGDPVSDSAQAVTEDGKKRAPATATIAPIVPPANPLAPPPPPSA